MYYAVQVSSGYEIQAMSRLKDRIRLNGLENTIQVHPLLEKTILAMKGNYKISALLKGYIIVEINTDKDNSLWGKVWHIIKEATNGRILDRKPVTTEEMVHLERLITTIVEVPIEEATEEMVSALNTTEKLISMCKEIIKNKKRVLRIPLKILKEAAETFAIIRQIVCKQMPILYQSMKYVA